jgi:hypothetical protein
LLGFRSFHLGTPLTGNRGRMIAAHDVVLARSGMGLRVPSASGRRSFFSRAISSSRAFRRARRISRRTLPGTCKRLLPRCRACGRLSRLRTSLLLLQNLDDLFFSETARRASSVSLIDGRCPNLEEVQGLKSLRVSLVSQFKPLGSRLARPGPSAQRNRSRRLYSFIFAAIICLASSSVSFLVITPKKTARCRAVSRLSLS